MRSSGLFRFIFAFVGLTLLVPAVHAGGWSKTDNNAKTIARVAAKLHKKMRRIERKSDGDDILAKDNLDELMIDTEVRLTDAFNMLIFFAYKSPNQKRYLARISKHLPRTTVKKIKWQLKRWPKFESEDKLVPWVAESIYRLSETLSRKEVNRARSKYKSIESIASNR